jgi:hypothetical protein
MALIIDLPEPPATADRAGLVCEILAIVDRVDFQRAWCIWSVFIMLLPEEIVQTLKPAYDAAYRDHVTAAFIQEQMAAHFARLDALQVWLVRVIANQMDAHDLLPEIPGEGEE